MNVVLIIPTGIAAEIGGHAGDANPVARLIGSSCDKLITHPNVVNASDINEMTPNTLYVEGSILDRFLEGDVKLKEVKNNKLLLVVNAPASPETINAVSAARCTLGIDIEVVVLKENLILKGKIEKGKATGTVENWEKLVEQIQQYEFDALAMATPIIVEKEIVREYYKKGGVNPWGAVEAKASKLIADKLNKPVAHAPVERDDIKEDKSIIFLPYKEVVDPRIAAEVNSVAYLHCVLKGLHKAPRINNEGLSNKDVNCMITPINVFGRPHKACLKAGIPVIAVAENKTVLNDKMPDDFIIVKNYLEAVGVMRAIEAGISLESLRRPIKKTKVS